MCYRLLMKINIIWKTKISLPADDYFPQVTYRVNKTTAFEAVLMENEQALSHCEKVCRRIGSSNSCYMHFQLGAISITEYPDVNIHGIPHFRNCSYSP